MGCSGSKDGGDSENVKLVDKELTKLPSLKANARSIEVIRCKLPAIDPDFPSKHGLALQSLRIASNKLTSLPDDMGQLTSLRIFSVSSNKIEKLPLSLFTITAITNFGADANCLTNLPDEIGDLVNLQTLDLGHNKIETIPATVSKLTKLQSFGIASNLLKELPAGLCTLKLVTLKVDYNQIEALPENIGDMDTLVKFEFQGNPLKNLPESFVNIGSSKVAAGQDVQINITDMKVFPTPPQEVRKLGPKAIMQFYTDRGGFHPDPPKDAAEGGS